jgi:hypothetical protein
MSLRKEAQTLYVYGGYQDISGEYMNDFWAFNLSTNSWAWLSGQSLGTTTFYPPSLSDPGTRSRASCWVTSTAFYIYAGKLGTTNTYSLASMYNFSFASRSWSWIFGPSLSVSLVYPSNMLPVIGKELKGLYNVAPSSYLGPPGRWGAATCMSKNGSVVYILGGALQGNVNVDSSIYQIADLWKYDIKNNSFTALWVKSIYAFWTPRYVDLNLESPIAHPGMRYGGMIYEDHAGNLVLYGGLTMDADFFFGKLSRVYIF